MGRLEIATLDEATAAKLAEEAQRRGLTPEELAAELIQLSLQPPRKKYRDASRLAGTWTKEEAREFEEAVAPFGQIDEELWREPEHSD